MVFERNQRVEHIQQKHSPYSGKSGRVTHFDGDEGYVTGRKEEAVWVAYDDPSLDPREKWTDTALLIPSPLSEEIIALMDRIEGIEISRATFSERQEIIDKLELFGILHDNEDCWRDSSDRIIGRLAERLR